MKKRASKKTSGAKPAAAKKKTSGAKAKKPAAKVAAAATPRPTPYTPPPLKGDGWPPFRYPLQ
jgi:hypothetical protein